MVIERTGSVSVMEEVPRYQEGIFGDILLTEL